MVDRYIQEKIDPIIKPLMLDLVKTQPDNIPLFISNWIKEHYPTADTASNKPESSSGVYLLLGR